MGGRFASFDANRLYLSGAIAQIDQDDTESAYATLTRCLGDIDPDGLSTPIDAGDPDYIRYQRLQQIVSQAIKIVGSDPNGARQALSGALREFGWNDQAADEPGE
jgi:hypothetical protein